MILKKLFPSKTQFALTFSYDDGPAADRGLVALFNKYGLKGTFHLNSALLDCGDRVTSAEVPALYAGHEVACHTTTHVNLDEVDSSAGVRAILDDRRRLEELTGNVVRGMSYPCGAYNAGVINTLKTAGIVYCRTASGTERFRLPDDFLAWTGTAHHGNPRLFELADQYFDSIWHRRSWCGQSVFYIWGHSFEFDRKEGEWERMEEFCKKVSGSPDIWYATNIQIYDYVQAQRALQISVDEKIICNPSAISVFVEANGAPLEIGAGEIVKL